MALSVRAKDGTAEAAARLKNVRRPIACLKKSARMVRLRDSPGRAMRRVRLTLRSTFHAPGPRKALRPEVPRIPSAGCANAAEFRSRVPPAGSALPGETAYAAFGRIRFALWFAREPDEAA